MKPATLLASIVFSVFALLHLLRLLLHVEVIVNGARVPMWVSPLALLFFAGMAVIMWRESRVGSWRGQT